MFLFVLVLLELAELLFLLAFDAFDELGDDVDAVFEPDALLLALLLLLFELLLPPPEFEDPDDPPEDSLSCLSLIIIYTVVNHLFINFQVSTHSRKLELPTLLIYIISCFLVFTLFKVSQYNSFTQDFIN